MPFGRVSLANGSAIVEGVNTEFTKELENGDFVVVRVGGITYTLPVLSVESDTRMIVVREFPGPSEAELAWKVIPRETQNRVSAEMMSQATEALRILNIDKRNWQEVFSADRDITVTLRDGTTVTGPSWKKLAVSTNRLYQEHNTETWVYSDVNKTHRLTLQSSGGWGVYNEKNAQWVPLSLSQGGTGVNSLQALHNELGLGWFPADDPKVLEYIDWLTAGVNSTETMVRIGIDSIDIQGIIRTRSSSIFRLKKGLPGLPNFRISYSPAMFSGSDGTMNLCYIRTASGSATNFDVIMDGMTGWGPVWYMVNASIRYVS